MIKQTENYSIEFDLANKRFTSTQLATGKTFTVKRPNMILVQKAYDEINKMSGYEIDAMCASDFP